MHRSLRWLGALSSLLWAAQVYPAPGEPARKVFILPLHQEIELPLVYFVRRGVKEAIQNGADILLLDLDTNGGRIDATEQILQVLNQFKGERISYVNRKALSAGAFIAFATRKIFMAPGSVIGAAAPLMLGPAGVTQLPETAEAKMTSAIRALVRACAETNGYNLEVVDAMIDRNKELKIGDETLNEKGQILTLTAAQAAKPYGPEQTPLLSAGTVESLDELLTLLKSPPDHRVYLHATGLERFGAWINRISPLLLLLGILGVYLEIKTPGFGLPGVIGIVGFTLYFFGGYVAGLSGLEWLALFLLGLSLLLVELFLFPGTLLLGFAGVVLIVVSLVMAMVDVYPGGLSWPSLPQLRTGLTNLSIAGVAAAMLAWVLSRWLPKTSLYHSLVSHSVSGSISAEKELQKNAALVGQKGVAVSNLRPGGKARFGDALLDVISQGELIEKGRSVKIIGSSAHQAVVEACD